MRRRLAAFLVVLSAAVLAPARAHAVDRETCFSSAETAQKLRAQGHLREARERLLTCAQKECPTAVQSDCSTWLAQVEADLPSIVVQAHDTQGNDLPDVAVLVDGSRVADRLDGRPIELDPGPHALRLERSGSQPVDRSIVLVEGQKERQVEATLEAVAAPPASTVSRPDAIPRPVWILGAVGAAALVSTAVLWVWGRSEFSSLQNHCAPSCDPSSVSAVRTKLVAGDVSLGVAVVALGVGGWFYFTRDRGGGRVGFQARF
ncbi:MAG TPA: hypothetical protein VF765_25440 [Polyangiaceae bacterium]